MLANAPDAEEATEVAETVMMRTLLMGAILPAKGPVARSLQPSPS